MEAIMRLDKFLKVSRLIKRRTVAKEAADGGRISINGKTAKAASEIKLGDLIEIGFGDKALKAEVLELRESIRAEEAKNMYKILP
jgi:ribosomal 50S subunit-recycling heat shock protein